MFIWANIIPEYQDINFCLLPFLSLSWESLCWDWIDQEWILRMFNSRLNNSLAHCKDNYFIVFWISKDSFWIREFMHKLLFWGILWFIEIQFFIVFQGRFLFYFEQENIYKNNQTFPLFHGNNCDILKLGVRLCQISSTNHHGYLWLVFDYFITAGIKKNKNFHNRWINFIAKSFSYFHLFCKLISFSNNFFLFVY